MPYISKEEVANRRKAIKNALPGFKCSVTMDGVTCMRVAVMSGPINLLPLEARQRGHVTVNPYHHRLQFAMMPEAVDVLDRVMEIAAAGRIEESTDSDYGSIPSFYLSVEIGKWDQPYKTTRG